jgi:hypothetical protein
VATSGDPPCGDHDETAPDIPLPETGPVIHDSDQAESLMRLTIFPLHLVENDRMPAHITATFGLIVQSRPSPHFHLFHWIDLVETGVNTLGKHLSSPQTCSPMTAPEPTARRELVPRRTISPEIL